MEIRIIGEPKEIAALVVEAQERRKSFNVNIEAPIETIKEALTEALRSSHECGGGGCTT